MSEKNCSNCNTLLWKEESKYGGSQKKIEFNKENTSILKVEFDTDTDSVILELVLSCKTCNEEELLSLNGYTPYGALESSFN